MRPLLIVFLCFFSLGCDNRQKCASDLSLLADQAFESLSKADAESLRSVQARMRRDLANCDYDHRARYSTMSLELDAVGISILANDPEALRLAISAGVPGTIRYRPKIGTGYRTSLLHLASAYGDRALVEAVIKAYGRVDERDSVGHGVLISAVDNPGDACGVARVLIEAGAGGAEEAIGYAEVAKKKDVSMCIAEAIR